MLSKSGSWLSFLVMFSWEIIGDVCRVFFNTFSNSSICFAYMHFCNPCMECFSLILCFGFSVLLCNNNLAKSLMEFETRNFWKLASLSQRPLANTVWRNNKGFVSCWFGGVNILLILYSGYTLDCFLVHALLKLQFSYPQRWRFVFRIGNNCISTIENCSDHTKFVLKGVVWLKARYWSVWLGLRYTLTLSLPSAWRFTKVSKMVKPLPFQDHWWIWCAGPNS